MIHDGHPFAVPEEERDPLRRLRGRLAAPVTVVTAGAGAGRTGLTVSSLVVADGEPGSILFLCGNGAELGDVIAATGGFVVHLLDEADAHVADRFAGIRPAPGGLFAGLDVADGRRGPELAGRSRAVCALRATTDLGWYRLIEGVVEEVVMGEPAPPLLRHRGRYRGLAD